MRGHQPEPPVRIELTRVELAAVYCISNPLNKNDDFSIYRLHDHVIWLLQQNWVIYANVIWNIKTYMQMLQGALAVSANGWKVNSHHFSCAPEYSSSHALAFVNGTFCPIQESGHCHYLQLQSTHSSVKQIYMQLKYSISMYKVSLASPVSYSCIGGVVDTKFMVYRCHCV